MRRMDQSRRRPFARPLSNPRFVLALWGLVGLVGWSGVVLLGATLLASTPPKAGFDLELLLAAGRRVAAGLSPYDPSLTAGAGLTAENLFYSYPPPVAQALALVAGVPSAMMLFAWGLGATIALALVARALARRFDPTRPASAIVIPTLALAPFLFPFTVAILFGNLDAWFPALYGSILLGALAGGRVGWAGAGFAFALAAATKIHPASLGLWFLVRGWRTGRSIRMPGPWFGLAFAVGTVAFIAAISIAVGSVGPWRDYLGIVRAASSAELLDTRNIGPAAQIAILSGGSESLVRLIQIPVTALAVMVTIWSAWSRRDAVESLAWASMVSLVTLPVSWFHYPVVVVPFAVAALARERARLGTTNVRRMLALAAVVAGAAVLAPVVIWAAVGLVLLAVGRQTETLAGRDLPQAGWSLARSDMMKPHGSTRRGPERQATRGARHKGTSRRE